MQHIVDKIQLQQASFVLKLLRKIYVHSNFDHCNLEEVLFIIYFQQKPLKMHIPTECALVCTFFVNLFSCFSFYFLL